MVQRRPELFFAYVGTGNVGSWRANIQVQVDFLLAKARAANDRKRVEQLEEIGKRDPTSAERPPGDKKRATLRTNNDGSNNSIISRRIANRCPEATASELLIKLIRFYQGRV